MSENQETIADIVAEMRTLHFSLPYKIVCGFLDRIEAAHKREVDKLNSVIQSQRSAFNAEQDRQRRAAPGDAAKMREALAWVDDCLKRRRVVSAHEIGALRTQIAAALAKPPRNCDRFKTKEEAAIAFAKEKKQWIPQQVLWELAPWLDWLFATATKGATDGSK